MFLGTFEFNAQSIFSLGAVYSLYRPSKHVEGRRTSAPMAQGNLKKLLSSIMIVRDLSLLEVWESALGLNVMEMTDDNSGDIR